MALVAEADPAVAVHLQEVPGSLQCRGHRQGPAHMRFQRSGQGAPHGHRSTTDLGQCECTQRFSVRPVRHQTRCLAGRGRSQGHDQVIVRPTDLRQVPFDDDLEAADHGQVHGEAVHQALRLAGAPSAAGPVAR
ncbi:hypothetical protein ADL33_18150 [Streptomyces sp. NRRL WC-3604]|nr:hypothetical protein ADL33_18150 [Streptomyces sp. NRRL WC-3604]